MEYTNFQVGENFPLPISVPGDGGLLQIDTNGIMFILKLSRTDLIAAEAFRTGKMELALFTADDLLFLLYQIDGIFKKGWGDAPLGIHLLPAAQKPTLEQLSKDKCLHMYLVDTRLNTLIAMRDVVLDEDFFQLLYQHAAKQLDNPFKNSEFVEKVQHIWQKYTPAEMREKAAAVQEIPFSLEPPPSKQIKH